MSESDNPIIILSLFGALHSSEDMTESITALQALWYAIVTKEVLIQVKTYYRIFEKIILAMVSNSRKIQL